MRRPQLALGLLLCFGLFSFASADGVDLKAWFPDNPSMEFFPGKVATAVIGVRNTGKSPVNITAAIANLALVSAPEGNIFNFSTLGYQLPPVAAGEETNVEYGLLFPKNMPPREFFLNVNLVLGADGGYTAQQLFNETINVIEEARFVDVELIGLYALLLLALAGGVYGLLELAKRQGWVKKARKGKVGTTAVAGGDKSEWLKGTAADPTKKKAVGKQI